MLSLLLPILCILCRVAAKPVPDAGHRQPDELDTRPSHSLTGGNETTVFQSGWPHKNNKLRARGVAYKANFDASWALRSISQPRCVALCSPTCEVKTSTNSDELQGVFPTLIKLGLIFTPLKPAEASMFM